MSVTAITDTRQYLTFRLGEEVFALEVSHVREILEFTTVARVPKTPEYMRGVINLRGSVVPVLDMGLKFGLAEIGKTVDTCVIVVEVPAKKRPPSWEPWSIRSRKYWSSSRSR